MSATIDIDGTDPWISFSTTLEGAVYGLEFSWNTRDERWYLSVYDDSGTALAAGVAVVIDFSLLTRFSNPALPPGALMALDTTGNQQEISAMEDLGQRVQLIYLSAAEVAGVA